MMFKININKKKTFLTIIIIFSITVLVVHKTTEYLQKRKLYSLEYKILNYFSKTCSNNTALVQQRLLNLNSISDDQLKEALKDQNITNGGCWSPSNCKKAHRVAIIIPFRNREAQLNIFLLNMHSLFAKQQISYCIYLIEPVSDILFNRGILMNIGFVESNSDSNNTWECHAFHDIDMISENEYTPYYCPKYPTLLTVKVNRWNYGIPYLDFFGGVTIMRKEHFIQANGYSNLFFGWGAEDDDHANRILKSGLKIIRPLEATFIGRYTSLSHETAEPNAERFNILQQGRNKYNKEGLNTLVHQVIKIVKTEFYTKFYVYYNKKELFQNSNVNLG